MNEFNRIFKLWNLLTAAFMVISVLLVSAFFAYRAYQFEQDSRDAHRHLLESEIHSQYPKIVEEAYLHLDSTEARQATFQNLFGSKGKVEIAIVPRARQTSTSGNLGNSDGSWKLGVKSGEDTFSIPLFFGDLYVADLVAKVHWVGILTAAEGRNVLLGLFAVLSFLCAASALAFVLLRKKVFSPLFSEVVFLQQNAAIATATMNLAHDIKNPLITFDFVAQSTHWDEFSSLKPQMKRSLETIREILGGLGNASDTKTLRIRELSADLETVVSDLATIYGREGTSVVYNGPQPFAAKLDLIAIERSIGNFVKNAAEAGAHNIEVKASIAESDLILKVSDDGPGVPVAVLEKLFKRGATAGKSGGSGIGLHNVKNIAQAHGGSVSHSREGGRTVFEIVLPNALILESAPQEIVTAVTEPIVTAPVVAARSILVKLPDAERQRLICAALKRNGLEVVTNDPGDGQLALIYADFDSTPEHALKSKVRTMFDDEDYSVEVACKKICQIFASIVSPLTQEATT